MSHYGGEEQEEGRLSIRLRGRVTYGGSASDGLEDMCWPLHPAKWRHMRKVRLVKERKQEIKKKVVFLSAHICSVSTFLSLLRNNLPSPDKIC